MKRFVVASSIALASCGRPPPPAAAPPLAPDAPPARSLGPLVGVGVTEDRARPLDGPPIPDGKPDYTFRVRISGEVAGIVLSGGDGRGFPISFDSLDTYVGRAAIPHGTGSAFKIGAKTWTIAVVRGDGSLVNPDGDLPKGTVFRDEIVSLYCSAVWPLYREGRQFLLAVVRPDGTIDRSSALLIDTPPA